jgi:ABC-type branched-subunit amino acid transport system substrate-binding protein
MAPPLEVTREPAPTPLRGAPAEPLPEIAPPPKAVERLALRPPLTAPATPRPSPVRVAILLPLSGANAALGRALLDAAQLALFELGGERLTLMPRDTRGTPEGAARAAQLAVAGGAELLLGPLFGTSVAAAAPAARAGGVNIVAFSTDRKVAGAGVFLMGFMPEQQVDRVVAFARAKGLSRFAVLAPDSAYGTAVVNALRRATSQRDANVVRVEFYPSDAREAHDPVKRLADYGRRRGALVAERKALAARSDEVSKQALERLNALETMGGVGFDAVMLADGGATLRAVAPLLPYYDIDPAKVHFLGTGLWDDPTLGTEPALVGGWFAAPPPAAAAAFDQRYAGTYGRQPPRIASLAYDAVALAAMLALEEAGPDYSAAALSAPSGFAGTGGIFRFGADGVVQRGLAVLEVEPRGLKVVGEAPGTFQELGY